MRLAGGDRLAKIAKEFFGDGAQATEGKIPQFLADEAFHTCATLGVWGESQRPMPLVTFGIESNIKFIYIIF